MGYLNFKDGTVEEIFRRFKWARKNTVELFKSANENKILYKTLDNNSQYEIKNVLFQFQCILTTTDTYKRKILNSNNKSFGILIIGDEIVEKDQILVEDVLSILTNQVNELGKIYKNANLDNIIELVKILDHEHMHHGELIVMFRANNIDLPDRFKKSWNL